MIQIERQRPGRLARLTDLIDALDEVDGAVPRVELMIDGMRDLLDGEVGGFNDVDLVDGRAMVVLRPAVVPDPSTRVQRTLDKHPIVVRYRTHPEDSYPKRLSDHVSGLRAKSFPLFRGGSRDLVDRRAAGRGDDEGADSGWPCWAVRHQE